MQELLAQIEKYQTEDVPDDMFDKVIGEILPGAKVKVYWNDRIECDEGYAFVLPEQDAGVGDVCIHIPEMDNSDGIGNGEEIHIHLFEILTNERVKKVSFKGGFL